MKLSEFTKISIRESLSGIFGAISIAFWLITVYPQLIENYKRKSGDSLSLHFLCLWLIGDIFSLIGSIWGKLISVIIAVQVYFFLADLLLILQILYYKRKPSLRSKVRLSTLKGATLSQFFVSLAVVIIFGILGWIITVLMGGIKKPELEYNGSSGFLVVGYIGSFFYLFARIPQIIKNYKSKSTDGLSPLFFAFTVLGNLTYIVSILLIDISRKYILINLPWLLSSFGTLFMDFLIFAQFISYRRRRKSEGSSN
ncbi:hypothetical protein PNEG_02166 [Pneumocystis murina B123]|uniref:Uncharacterized protein n=1 Tax=Pneumocystis murina (strain B123) TaxID=1069680 RepID=M7NR41_PNEMU|nr:hypothetical protein PNEG_02166 [Pneumocystis murina B123]EMR09580.1 hypothetical protein PNEG_02166 [Pneumocystis murina B123]